MKRACMLTFITSLITIFLYLNTSSASFKAEVNKVKVNKNAGSSKATIQCSKVLGDAPKLLSYKSLKTLSQQTLKDAQKDPGEAFINLISELSGGLRRLENEHPMVYSIIHKKIIPPKEGIEFLRRQYEQLFHFSTEPVVLNETKKSHPTAPVKSEPILNHKGHYQGKNIGIDNRGIATKNAINLFTNIEFLNISLHFLKKLNKADKLLIKNYNRAVSQTNNDNPIIGDITFTEIFKITQFSPIPEMISSIKTNLPKEDQANPEIIKKNLIELIRLFHDDINQVPIALWPSNLHTAENLNKNTLKKIIKVQKLIPLKFSHVYMDHLNIESPQETQAFLWLKKLLDTEFPRKNYEQLHLRTGYYHANGALATLGYSSNGLFKEVKHRDKLLRFFSKKFAAAYKYLTKKSVEGPVRKQIRRYIRRKHPVLYFKFLTGSLELKHIVGKPKGSSFKGGPFNKLLDPKNTTDFNLFLKWMQENSPEVQKMESQSATVFLRRQVLDEYILWFKNYRTIKQHGSAVESLNEIDKMLGL